MSRRHEKDVNGLVVETERFKIFGVSSWFIWHSIRGWVGFQKRPKIYDLQIFRNFKVGWQPFTDVSREDKH